MFDVENIDKDKLIIFDDPMNSNDDIMQYIIISELTKLINGKGKNDKIVILTHNLHFYLNVTYKTGYKKSFKYHLQNNGKNTTIKKIENENEDFKTSYDAMWKELKYLYEVDEHIISAAFLINPMRRILETYIKFNCLNKNEFFIDDKDSDKLFNVNSHSIDDLEAELNGFDKERLLKLFKKCFINNNAVYHFDKHWVS